MVEVTGSLIGNRESPATRLIVSPNHTARPRLVAAQGAHGKGRLGRCLCQGKPSYPAEASPRVHGKLMCRRENTLNCPTGWFCGLPNRQPVPPCLFPPREAETRIEASETLSVARALAYAHCQLWDPPAPMGHWEPHMESQKRTPRVEVLLSMSQSGLGSTCWLVIISVTTAGETEAQRDDKSWPRPHN